MQITNFCYTIITTLHFLMQFLSAPGLQCTVDYVSRPPPHFAVVVHSVKELSPSQVHRLDEGRVEVWIWILPRWS